MPTIELSAATHTRLMALVNPLMGVDEALTKLMDHAGIPTLESRASVPEPDAGRTKSTESGDRGRSRASSHGARPSTTRPGRARRGTSLDRERYFRAILLALHKRGGSGASRDIQDAVFEMLEEEMTEVDLATLPKNKNEQRWRNHVRFAREYLVKNGFLRDDSDWGCWDLTVKGERAGVTLELDFDSVQVRF